MDNTPNWTPSCIGQMASSIESRAHEIDQMLWYVNRYPTFSANMAKFRSDLADRAKRLAIDIKAFRALDTDAILKELEKI